MNDIISRQAAIDAIKRYESADSYDINEGLIMAMNAVADVPTIDPVKHGKWKPFDLTWGRSVYACSACGEAFEVPTEMGKPIYTYCPNCGARMDGE